MHSDEMRLSAYSTIKDEEIVAKIRLGDKEAIEFLMNKYKNLVRKKARAYFLIGGDKDDIIQEGMIGLYKAVRDYDESKASSFITFADLCVTRQIYTAVKSHARLKHMPLNSYISLNKSAYDDENDTMPWIEVASLNKILNPEELLIDKENLEQIEQALDQNLSKLEKKVLKLYLEGFGYIQIGELLDKSSKTVDNALQRIKRKLDEIIKAQ